EAGRYLEPSAGAANLNLFRNLRKTLRPAVRAALQTAFATHGPAVHDNVEIRIDGRSRPVTVIVEPISGGRGGPGLFVVAFLEGSHGIGGNGGTNANATDTAAVRA